MNKNENWPNSMDGRTASRYVGLELKPLRYRGGGPKYVKRGRTVRYLRRDLDAWLESLKVSNAAEASERRQSPP